MKANIYLLWSVTILLLPMIRNDSSPKTPLFENRDTIDSLDVRIILESKKVNFYTIGDLPVEKKFQVRNKKYVDYYEIVNTRKLNYEASLSAKTELLCTASLGDQPKCTMLPKYCLSFTSKSGTVNFYFPAISNCNAPIVLKINTLNKKEKEFAILDSVYKKLLFIGGIKDSEKSPRSIIASEK